MISDFQTYSGCYPLSTQATFPSPPIPLITTNIGHFLLQIQSVCVIQIKLAITNPLFCCFYILHILFSMPLCLLLFFSVPLDLSTIPGVGGIGQYANHGFRVIFIDLNYSQNAGLAFYIVLSAQILVGNLDLRLLFIVRDFLASIYCFLSILYNIDHSYTSAHVHILTHTHI